MDEGCQSETDGDPFENWLTKTLDEDEVKEAQDRMKQIHPMQFEPLDSIFPFLKWFRPEQKSISMDNKTKVLQVEKKQKQIEDKLKIHLCI